MPEFIADQIRVYQDWGTPKTKSVPVQPATIVCVDPRRAEEAIRALGLAFPWHLTSEGEAFWFDIIKRLARIRDRGR
jgi:hypothetical protein